jgi:hypothetical protein
MIEPILITSSFLLGKEFVNQTITKTTSNIYSNINSILVDSNFELKSLLDDLDINTKLDIINSFISSCDFNENEEINKKKNSYSITVKKTLNYIADILKRIENEIENIKKASVSHKEKWFYYLRTPEYSPMVNNLVKHLKILEERFNFLLNILKINH